MVFLAFKTFDLVPKLELTTFDLVPKYLALDQHIIKTFDLVKTLKTFDLVPKINLKTFDLPKRSSEI